MNTCRCFLKGVVFVALATALMTACGKKASAPPISIDQVPQVLHEAFKEAQPEVSAAAQEVIASARAAEPDVLLQAHELGERPDLTDEQRKAAYRAAAALHRKVVEDAARGDQKAEEALKAYQARK